MHTSRAAAAVHDHWERECVDCPASFGRVSDRSLQVDGAGHTHIVYGADHAYYAYFDGVDWAHELVDKDPGVGESASLALGPDGVPHISYFAQDMMASGNVRVGSLRHAYRSATGWRVETVRTDTPVYTAMAVDAAGFAHIAYQSDSTFTLQYTFQDAAGWHIETVDAVGWVGSYPSLAIDRGGNPLISYLDSSQTALKIARRSAAGWQTEIVDDTDAVGYYTSLAVDAANRAHIAYFDLTNANLKSAVQVAGGWQIAVVDSAGDVGRYTSLALDAAGLAHVSYYDRTNGDLKAAHQLPGGWRVEVVDSAGDVGSHSAVDLSAAGSVHISYYGADELKLAVFDALVWRVARVDGEGVVGAFPALAVDRQDGVRIAFYDSLHADLKYAVRDATGWRLEVVDSVGDVGGLAALALDAVGHPYVSYYDATNAELKYAFRDATGWMVYSVDRVGAARQQSGLAVDTFGYPHISYSHATGNSWINLKYAYKDASGWRSEIIDDSGQVTGGSALRLDQVNRPHLVYSRSGALRYMYRDWDGWHAEVLDAARFVLDYGPTLALDAQGLPHVAYSNDRSGEVIYARRTGAGWELEAVPWAVYASKRITMVLDRDGFPHLAYREAFLGRDIIYVYKDAQGWHRQVVDDQTLNVDDEAMDKGFVSISLDSAGTPLLAYSSEAPTFDLMLAAGGVHAAATAGVAGRAWYDTLHGDGIRQPGEDEGVAGVPITVYSASGQQVAVVLTDSFGRYEIGGLEAGTYEVRAQPTSSLVITSRGSITVNLGPDEWREDLDFGFVSTTGVLMQDLTAQRHGQNVVVIWTTAREAENEGFHVLRAAAVDGVYERLTVQTIPSQALGASGASYIFVDRNPPLGQTVWYRIAALPSGQLFGPVASSARTGHASFLPMVLRDR